MCLADQGGLPLPERLRECSACRPPGSGQARKQAPSKVRWRRFTHQKRCGRAPACSSRQQPNADYLILANRTHRPEACCSTCTRKRRSRLYMAAVVKSCAVSSQSAASDYRAAAADYQKDASPGTTADPQPLTFYDSLDLPCSGPVCQVPEQPPDCVPACPYEEVTNR